MSTADVFLSSPAGPARFDPCNMSSSPGLPSLDEIFANGSKRPPFRAENNAAPMPVNARTTFTSAASQLREAPEIDIETEEITISPPRASDPRKAQKKKVLTSEVVSISTEAPILIESSPGEKPWQKFGSKKPVSQDRQSSTSKGRVTKSTAKGKSKEKSETVSKHFAIKETVANCTDDNSNNGTTTHKLKDQTSNDPYCLEPALRRRSDWTPPPVDSPILLGSESDSRELPSSIDPGMGSRDVFQSLQDQYGHKTSQSTSTSDNSQKTDIMKKRKLIELVSTSSEIGQRPKETSPTKVAVTKKKTRTITELATAPYMMPIEPRLDLTGPTTKESLLSYFDEDGAVKALVEHQTAVMSQKKEKGKEPKTSAKPKRKKKAGTANNPILLSPSSALKQSSNQDFVFGTSSQLVIEESPTTLRNLQLAIQASNRVDSDPFAESDSQGLWHAGARDTDGELMKMDDIALIEDIPSPPRLRGQSQQLREEFTDINDILKSPEISDSTKWALRRNINSFQSQDIPRAQLPQIDHQEHTESQPTGEASEVEVSNPRPNFESLTDAQLSKQIASYGFKPVKKRQAMIALLDQCWSSKSSGPSIPQSKSISTTATTAAPKKRTKKTTQPEPEPGPEPENPPKRRGRPRKTSTTEASSTSKTPAPKPTTPKKARGRPKKDAPKPIEIADSDDDDPASPSSSRPSSPDQDRIFSSPPAVDLSLSEDADLSLALSPTDPTDQQTELFKHITRAVTSAPRSKDPANPSWHEKMLLYDPIVLEDLAAWLNAGVLSEVGYDAEVSPSDVKRWCESKSVICLWKQNLRGKERKRY
ncbi:uncharacterized protein GGS22DRAFT_196475 [Annulohypoxylon maeteangense]|uniref:uncharacterized protein n=1 Tax=Annulohypoxylon maeteangense TaxID=1927788 RepID=UPI002007CA54|nr:uncharacterized protein GGS22DRAFT_196475 [Annulohypoxylon maeteangense]KAI0881558.1 hypothetical protein GGS22DRAFT_196475 [Annulohypoxylon maeteangense]